MAAAHQVLGRTVRMPVEIRTASAVVGLFSVRAAAAQRMVDYSGLRVLQPLPRRAVLALFHVRYVDGDLGRYDELGVGVMVQRHDARLRPAVLVHRLPVNGEFTMAAGRQIWGFPKELADFEVHETDAERRVVLTQHGQRAVELTVPRSGATAPDRIGRLGLRAYTHLDGVTRFIDWRMTPSKVRLRPRGAWVVLGEHPIGRELAELGLRKDSMVSFSFGNIRMQFDDALVVTT